MGWYVFRRLAVAGLAGFGLGVLIKTLFRLCGVT